MFLTLKKFSLRVMIPSACLIILVNLLLSDHYQSNPQKRIEEALAAGNHSVVKAEYHKLIQGDFFKVEYHRGYIRSHFGQHGRRSDFNSQVNQDVIEGYRRYAASTSPKVSDIGYYGLGFFYSLREDHERARENFQQVRNTQLPYLNNSLGSVYRRTGRLDLAKQHFDREIELGGNVAGAYSNLAQLYYATKQYSELKEIAARPEARNSIPRDIRRFLTLREGNYTDYIWQSFGFRAVSAYGLLGAVLILSVWFVYLQQIDMFEPKRLRYSGIILAGGMIFSCFAPPLYDAFAFGLRPNGTYLNDLLYYLFVVGLFEEALKVLPVLLMMRFTRAVEKPVDYIIYGSISALGFAFMENLLPSYEWRLGAISTRALGAVILHMTETSLVMYGLFYSRYRVKKKPLQYFLLAFGAACALHGIFDFSATRGWGVLSFLITIYCIRQYGMFIHCTLNLSERNPDEPKRLVHLTAYLCYSLAAIIMLQYVVSAVKFGPSNANSVFLGAAFFSYFQLCVILVNLGNFDIRKRQWLPLLRRKATSHVLVPSA
jgi:RsiW-degrading membrane proteinase PrsW (M82 family)